MIIGIGTDILNLGRISNVIKRYDKKFINRIYGKNEIRALQNKFGNSDNYFGKRFAAKEAMMKSLGTGKRGLLWVEIEVVRERGRAPTIVLHGNALSIAENQNIKEIQLTISHSRNYAVASTLAIKY